MKQIKLLLLLLLLLMLSILEFIQYDTEIVTLDAGIEIKEDLVVNSSVLNVCNDTNEAILKEEEKPSEPKKIVSWEESRDEHMYVVEQEPERLKKLIKGITKHPELSAAEKEFTISAIRYSENCPLECLDGYSKYKKEFEEKNPSGVDPETNYTFEELVSYHASYAERVREELEKNKEKEFFMN